MTDRLNEIRARLGAATPRPWTVDGDDVMKPATFDSAPFLVALDCEREADADLIAHAPADIAWLLAEVERLRAADAD